MRDGRGEGLTGNIPRLIAALALAVLGGAVFAWLRLPLPWMLGAMTASAAATFAGLRFEMPHALRVPMLGVLGVLLGSGFTTDVAAGMLRWAGSISALPVYIVLSLLAGVTFMRRVMHMDRVTAFFGAAPGGLSEMVLLGERAGGDMRTISLLHGTRVFMIVFCVPFIVRLIEQPGTAVLPPAGPTATLPELAVLAAALALGLWLGPLLRLPASFMLGPLLVSAAAHMADLVDSAPPRLAIVAAQIVIGTGLGSRFSGVPLRLIAQTVLTGGGLSVMLLGVTLAISEVLHALTGVNHAALMLAFSPGGIAEMGLVAVALGIDPLFVATHHVIRIGLVILMAPPLFRLWDRWHKRKT